MTTEHTDIALDAEGIPILTDLVAESELDATVAVEPVAELTPAEIARELLHSESVQLQLDEMAADLARDVRLQLEQTLAAAIDEAISTTLDNNNARTFENIRRQLDVALPGLLAKALQDNDLAS
jgi:FKBP-type peptidyl-prolyl cis-trans isomerase (trigger factor)